jgi:heptose-I-phosphate ethanolaminephosphotransferase
MSDFKKIFSNFLWVIIAASIFEFFYNNISSGIIFNLFENIMFAIALICPLYFINKNRLRKYYLVFSFIGFSLCVFLETIYYYLFKTYFSPSAIFVTLDSNISESKEFLSFYLDFPVYLFTIIFLIILIFIILKIYRLNIDNLLIPKRKKIIIFSLFSGLLIFLKVSALIVYNLPYLVLKSSVEYHLESEKLGDYKKNKIGNFNNVSRLSNDEEEIYVVIIGESTSRKHLGIYNYYRETTPQLNKRRDELFVYKDVISPHAYSVGALTKILTLANYENPEKSYEGSIIQLINNVGFETYWLSNQRPIGPYESMVTKICLSAKNHKFLTTTIAGNSKVLDEELLVEFDKVIGNNINKKFIFLHLMGTHHHYENRYPKNFKKFIDEPQTNFKSDESSIKVNHYDNAILYNDFIISKVIDKVDELNTKSFVLYFSDHGEEMYDNINTAGHNEDIYSQKMFEVPFFLWQSPKYKHDKKFQFIEDRKYMIDDLFHGIADLLSVNALEVDYSRSIFNENFKERKRIIKDTINFDDFFK